MRSPRYLATIFAVAGGLISTTTAENGCCADFTYPDTDGQVYNNIDNIIASYSSNYPSANLTLYCLNPGNVYTLKRWAVSSTGTFSIAHFTDDVTIEQYPSTCHLELENTEDTSNALLSPNFILTDITGVSISTYSATSTEAAATTAFVTITAAGTTETSAASASKSFIPVTSGAAASTASDVGESGASGTRKATAVGANATSSPKSSPSSSSLSTGAKAGIAVGVVAAVAILLAGAFYLMRTRRKLREAERRATMFQADAAAGGGTSMADGSRTAWSSVPQSEDTFSERQASVAGQPYPVSPYQASETPEMLGDQPTMVKGDYRAVPSNQYESYNGAHELGGGDHVGRSGTRPTELP